MQHFYSLNIQTRKWPLKMTSSTRISGTSAHTEPAKTFCRASISGEKCIYWTQRDQWLVAKACKVPEIIPLQFCFSYNRRPPVLFCFCFCGFSIMLFYRLLLLGVVPPSVRFPLASSLSFHWYSFKFYLIKVFCPLVPLSATHSFFFFWSLVDLSYSINPWSPWSGHGYYLPCQSPGGPQ